MTAPSYVNASAGATDNGGAWSYTGPAPAQAGNILVLQVLQDGTGADTIGFSGVTNCTALDGTAASMTLVTGSPFNVGSPTSAKQWLWIGRSTGTSAPVVSGTNSGNDDLYIRMYEFQAVNGGPTLVAVIENASAGSAVNGVGTSTSVLDTGVQTLGADRLACNFIAVDDEVAASELTSMTGETGGDWTYPVAAYGTATGTDGTLALVTATIASAGTINGGSDSITSQGWGVVGFAFIPSEPQSAVPGAASLTASGATPTVTVTANVLAQPGAASLTTSLATPTVIVGFPAIDAYLLEDASGHYALEDGSGALLGEWGGDQYALPAAAALHLTGSVPYVLAAEANNPNYLNNWRRGEVYRFIRGTTAEGFEEWRRGEVAGTVDTGSLPGAAVLPTAASLVLTGADSSVAVSVYALPDAGSLSLDGAVPSVETPVLCRPDGASLSLTAATPEVEAAQTYEPDAASLTAIGATPDVLMPVAALPDAASLVLTGETPTVMATDFVMVLPDPAELALSGSSPVIAAVLFPTEASLAFTGGTPDVTLPVLSAPDAAALEIVGDTPDIALTENVASLPDAASLTLTGGTPVVNAGANVTSEPTAASLELTGDVPVVEAGGTAVSLPTAGELILSAATPVVEAVQVYEPDPASLTATGDTPDIGLTENVLVLPDLGELVATPDTPTVATTENVLAEPDAAALELAGEVPYVSAGGSQVAVPDAASLTVAGAIPDVLTPVLVEPDAGSVTVTGATPTVGVTAHVFIRPAAAAITFGRATPTVVTTETTTVLPGPALIRMGGAVPLVIGSFVSRARPRKAVLLRAPEEMDLWTELDDEEVILTMFA